MQTSCVSLSEAYGVPTAGPLVSLTGCYPQGFKFHNNFRYNVTEDGRLQGDRDTCIVPKRGHPNDFGP